MSSPTSHESPTKTVPAVRGENTSGGIGLSGVSVEGRGVEGRSKKGVGVVGISENYRGVEGRSTNEHGVFGTSTKGAGVVGISDDNRGVQGRSTNEHGVFGTSTKGAGVVGVGDNYRGVSGRSGTGNGVYGESAQGTGVVGESDEWIGVYGRSKGTKGGAAGVMGEHTANGAGVIGKSRGGIAVFGTSETHEGVHAETKSTASAAMAAYQMNPDSNSPAFFAKHAGNRWAARFEGNVEVTGDIILPNADCAEDFDIADADAVQPGTVVVLGEDGTLHQSEQAYDRRVAGVVSGAGEYKPGIVLDKQQSRPNRKPIALLGKVYCKVDAQYGAIEIGDLLTTSPTSGHAMRADDPLKAFGAVIGKALRPFQEGQGLIPILIALQ